jgi:hypothetical protein
MGTRWQQREFVGGIAVFRHDPVVHRHLNLKRLNGTLSVQRADGTVRSLSQKSQVMPSDTLSTQKGSYAQPASPNGSIDDDAAQHENKNGGLQVFAGRFEGR